MDVRGACLVAVVVAVVAVVVLSVGACLHLGGDLPAATPAPISISTPLSVSIRSGSDGRIRARGIARRTQFVRDGLFNKDTWLSAPPFPAPSLPSPQPLSRLTKRKQRRSFKRSMHISPLMPPIRGIGHIPLVNGLGALVLGHLGVLLHDEPAKAVLARKLAALALGHVLVDCGALAVVEQLPAPDGAWAAERAVVRVEVCCVRVQR